MKPFIVLYGDTYYPSGWSDYAGEADSLEQAMEIVEPRDKVEEAGRGLEYSWWEIIDLRTKECVLRRDYELPPCDPRSL